MKALWALLTGVVLLGVAALVWPTSDGRGNPAANAGQADAPPQVAATKVEPPKQAPGSAAPATPPAVAAAAAKPSTPKVPAPASSAASTTKAAPAAPTAPAAPSAAAPAAPTAGGLALGLDRTIAHATVAPGSIVRKPDGSLQADGKFRIEGEGTREKPYRVTWELLSSSSRTYVPRLKQDRIPQSVAMLDGAWIRIDGYVAFPLMLQESAEVLVMLNQWDGCCIGVPPTPYDAIEAKLVQAVKPSKRHSLNFGSVTGRMRVDPLLVENWLVGLYRLEEATLTQDGL